MDRLLRAHTTSWIKHQKRVEQIKALLAQHLDTIRVDQLIVLLALPLGEGRLVVWERCHARPILLTRRTEQTENLEDLVNFGVAREEGLAGSHFGEDAADTPHVDAGAVLASAEQDFGRAVPEGDDLVGICAERDAKGAGKTEVSDFEVAVFVNEEVLGLEVAVEDAVGVAVAYALEKLKGKLLDLLRSNVSNSGNTLSLDAHYHSFAETKVAFLTQHALSKWLASTSLTDGQGLHVLLQVQVHEFEDEI